MDRVRRIVLLAAAVSVALAGCSASPGSSTRADAWPIAAPARPAHLDSSSPQAAVRSYLAWTTYAYRSGVSEDASPTMSADESVRVDSYLQLNKQKGRAIDQQLLGVAFGTPSREGTHTLLPAHERWRYRYLALDGSTALSPTYVISYDTTYTVITQGGRLVVDSVDAKPLGKVK